MDIKRKRLAEAAWRAANPERVKAHAAKYLSANKELARMATAAWRTANLEKVKAFAKRWRAANLEKLKQKDAKRYEAHKARRLAYQKEWRAANPDAKRFYKATRRAQKSAAGGTHKKADIVALKGLQRGLCAVCREPLAGGHHLDHIVPLAAGGTNDKYNLQLLCAICNCSKGAKDPIKFMQARGFLL